MAVDRAALQLWYREVMRGRVRELRALRERLEAGNRAAFDEARKIGMALRVSGATFGFPRVSEAAGMLETARDEDVLRRVEGLVSELRGVAAGHDDPVALRDWLARAVGLEPEAEPDGASGAASEGPEAAWRRIGRRAGLDEGAVAERVARYFGLQAATPSIRSRAARRLVPDAFVSRARVVPLGEDWLTITIATSDPTSLHVERAVERLTGRRRVRDSTRWLPTSTCRAWTGWNWYGRSGIATPRSHFRSSWSRESRTRFSRRSFSRRARTTTYASCWARGSSWRGWSQPCEGPASEAG